MKRVLLVLSLFFLGMICMAQTVEVPPQDFLSQVLDAIKGFGGLNQMGKISTIILLIVGSMKVTILNQWIWSKLGVAKAWIAPLLGLLAGIAGIGMTGPITLASVFAYVAAGGGAVILNELLEALKVIPGLGPVYVGLIDFISNSVILGGKATK